MAVSPFRAPTGVAGPGGATVTPGRTVTGLPQAGSPLMQQLIRFIQRGNPAVAVTPENVGQYAQTPGAFSTARGPVGGLPQMEKLWDALKAAGLARMQGGMAPSVTGMYRERGVNTNVPWTGFQSAAPIQGATAQVPVATLPGSSPGGVQPAPIAQTPVGPMVYPPGASPMGAVDPEPPFGTPAWFTWRYGPARAGAAARQIAANR